jgi:hypothetical protein
MACAILMALLSISLSACATPTDLNKVAGSTPVVTSVLGETPQAFRFGVPVDSETNALIAARSGLGSAFEYIQPLIVVRVQQMSYGDYVEQIGGSSGRPLDMKVWLVVYFDDRWQSLPPRPDVTPSPSFCGCVSVVIDAKDGLLLEEGGPLKPGRLPECDK